MTGRKANGEMIVLKMMRVIGFLFWLTLPGQLIAGTMTAEVDKVQSSLDEPFWLTVSIQGGLDSEVQVPESRDFEITRSGESTNISIVNGTVTKERQYTYQVRALREGSLKIPSLKAQVDGEELRTIEIAVEVKGGVAQPSERDVADNKKFVFVERDLPKTTLYEGEAILSTVRLLTRARLTGATPARDAAPDWRLIAMDGQQNKEVTRDGARWNAIELREGLIPLKSGTLKVPQFGISATWIQPTARKRTPRSIFDMLQNGGFNTGEEVSRKLLSDPVDVVVKPLPAPKPADFSDMVGAFSITSNVSRTSLKSGETATVTIEIKGQGALDRMKDVKLSVPGTRVYTDKPELKEKMEVGAGLISAKTLKFAVVPARPGSVDLGTVRLISFNPFTEKYETLTATLGQLTVSASSDAESSGVVPGGEQNSPQTQTNHNQEQTSEHGQEPKAAEPPLTPKTLTGESPRTRPWYLGPVALAIEVLLLSLLTGFFLVRGGWRRLSGVTPKENKIERETMLQLLRDLEGGRSEAFDQGILRLKTFLSAAGQDPAAMTPRDLEHGAESRKFDAAHFETLRRILTEMDRRAYGGGGDAPIDQGLMSALRDLLIYCQARSL